MNQPINAALQGLFEGYASLKKISDLRQDFQNQLLKIFESEEDFESKLKHVDNAFASDPVYSDLQEAVFDLLMVRFLSVDANRFDPDYFESPEWLQIEENTLDRGTELLNLFLYIDECKHDEMEASLEDFLDEFLLTQDEGFHEEHEIYASLIELQEMVDEEVADIVKASSSLEDSDPMAYYLLPILLFFNGANVETVKAKLNESHALQMAYLCSLKQYQNNL